MERVGQRLAAFARALVELRGIRYPRLGLDFKLVSTLFEEEVSAGEGVAKVRFGS